MSIPATPEAGDSGSMKVFVRAALPVVVASGAMALAVVAIRSNEITLDAGGAPPAQAPTPYSQMHEQVQQAPGDPEPQPPTF